TLALHDEAVLWLQPNLPKAKFDLRLIRPNWVVGWEFPNAFSRGDLVVHFPGAHGPQKLKAAELIPFHGWDPADARLGSSPVHALRSILAEQWEAQAFRLQM